MKLKRILSSALVVVMLFSAIITLIPIEAKAAHHANVSDTRLDTETVKAIVEAYQKAEFGSADEMFQYDKEQGYLDYATNGDFTIYVNRYTGVMYYRSKTGEMLTTNSYNFKGYGNVEELTSQVSVSYSTISDTENAKDRYSSTWAAKYNQINVAKIDNGLRVSYAIGDTANRCLLPVMIEAHEFEKDILKPMFEKLYETMKEYLGEQYAVNYFDESLGVYDEEKVFAQQFLHVISIRTFDQRFKAAVAKYTQDHSPLSTENSIKISKIEAIMGGINVIINAYQPYNPSHASFKYDENTTPAITLEGYSVYKVKDTDYAQMAVKAKYVRDYCTGYTFEMMYEDEKFCGYEHKYEPKPVFRCSLEYTFNEDGSLSVRLPANSIVFDETEYILKSITPLQYFGAADFSNDGYIFLPDGSGSIIEFEDFRNSNIAMSSSLSIYGHDFCYSEISGAHKQPLTMPVYGIASAGLGYFAILEEGASMAAMNVRYRHGSFRDGSVYTTFTPYPTDKFDLSETVSVGGVASYSKVSESKYSGSYVTRYVMLSGANASYMGMANYYRQYLINNGTLSPMQNVSNDLPLYLEALGSLEVVEKILTFPVNVSKPITTFEDIATIYDDLNNAKTRLEEKAKEYDALAEAEDDNLALKDSYIETAANYRRLIGEIVNIYNVNFKLTGFTNGGLYFTYPTRVKWERVLGGKRGFKKLLELADSETDEDSTLGIYPDFDFQYINNTSLFDGVRKRNTVSRMVDNRYASKQVYTSVMGKYDTVYAMIVSADALDRLYDKFIKKYDNYDAKGISVSTLGSDLNSNFDKKNPVSRDEAQGYITNLLDRIANENKYSVMIDQGNIYAVKYADHILGICTDSSYYSYSSYSIPFVGMVLHGCVNYTGGALNYSGSPAYDLLRSIENGAALYYIIGYQNTDYMKDDEEFNKFYSLSYENLFDDIVENYSIINKELGDLQDFRIVNHEVLIGERIIDDDEQINNLNALKNEFVEEFDRTIRQTIDAKLDELRGTGTSYDKRIGVLNNATSVDLLMKDAQERLVLEDGELGEDFRARLVEVIEKYQKEYNVENVAEENIVWVDVDTVTYDSKYQYVTDSTARDENYDRTDYTIDNDLIVMVTYAHEDGRTRSFILNYNIYSVRVVLEDGSEYEIDKYDYARIG